MGAVRFGLACAGLLVLLSQAGCQWVPRSQLAACESQQRALHETSKAQLAELENLKTHARTVENNLLQAEEELAALGEQSGVDRQRLARFQRQRDQVGKKFGNSASARAVLNGPLGELAKKYPSLLIDASAGIGKLDTDILFESGEATLKPESRGKLDEFANLLKSQPGHGLRVMVVGHTDNRHVAKSETRSRYPDNWHLSTARALAVADYLQKAGLREDQIGVTGYGRHQPVRSNKTPEERRQNRRVEIFVMTPQADMVGWNGGATDVY